jgi:hypothetical protein
MEVSMKKMFLGFVLFIISLSLFAQTATPPAVGDGTVGSPFEIATLENLYWLSQNDSEWSKHYIQTADIEAYQMSGWDSGLGWWPIGTYSAFTGSYDGQNFTINELYLSRGADDEQGLFGVVSGALIKNVRLTSAFVQGHDWVGALIGRSYNSTIENCLSTGSVNGNEYVGGLIGNLIGSTVNQSYSESTVNGYWYVGGFAGKAASSSLIQNSYSMGNVTVDNYAGGFIGEINDTNVLKCYSAGHLTYAYSEYVNGFIGASYGTSTVTSSFWDIDTSGIVWAGPGTGKVTADMKKVATFTNLLNVGLDSPWDFVNNPHDDTGNEDIWAIAVSGVYNNGYPYLRWRWQDEVLYAGGSGTELDPYLIETAEHLHNVRYYLGANFEQTANISLGVAPYNQGNGWEPIGDYQEFYGVYDGKNFTIDGLYIYGATGRAGLFMHTNQGEIHNVRLTNVDISGSGTEVGALAGSVYNYSTISNCSSSGNIYGNEKVGGLIGINWGNSSISKCYSFGNVSGYTTVGGLVGYNYQDSVIENSYSRASVSGSIEVGGFVGYNYSNSTNFNCYSTGLVSGTLSYVGGFVGRSTGSIVTACFWDMETSGQTTSPYGFGRTTTQMKTQSTFESASWNFDSIWAMNGVENDGYAYLQWQTEETLLVPQNLTFETWDSHVFLYWEAPVAKYTLLGYNIYRDGGTSPVNTGLITELEYADGSVVNDGTYSYVVTAVYSEGESGPSNEIQATPTYVDTPAPTNLTGTPGDNEALLTWDAPAYTAPLSLIRYDIYRNYSTSPIATVDIGYTEYIDNSVSNGQSYRYEVEAVYKYDISSKTSAEKVYVHPTPWSFVPGDIVGFSMQISGTLYIDNIENTSNRYWIGAFFPGPVEDCRGMNENSSSGYSFLVEGGSEEIEMYLNVYDVETETIYETAEYFNYIPNGPDEEVDIYVYTTTTYDLTISITGGDGYTTPEAGTHTYLENELVTLRAYPQSGYVFDKWDINSAIVEVDSTQITMTQDIYATAYFREDYEFMPATFFNAQHGDSQVQFTWSTPDDGGSVSGKSYMDYLLGYKVYRDGVQISNVIDMLYYTDSDVNNAQWYEYYVVAVYEHGESDPTFAIDVFPNPTPWQGEKTSEYTMQVSGLIYRNSSVEIDPNYWLGAFINYYDEELCVGISDNSAGLYSFNLQSPSDTLDVYFKLYDAYSGFDYLAEETLTFQHTYEVFNYDLHFNTVSSEYTLLISKNGNGSTEPEVGDHTYSAGSSVTLRAYPSTGWTFDYWLINGVQDNNSIVSVTMNENINAEAHFSPLPFDLVVQKDGEGTTLPEVGVYPYNYGDTINLLATAASNYVFDKWVINGYNVYQRYVTFTLSQNTTATAYFIPKPVSNITVDPNVYLVNTFPTVLEQFNVSATIFPATAFNQNVTWSSNRPDIATVQQTNQLQTVVTVQPNAPRGVARIRVKTEDGGLRAFSFVVVVNTTVDEQNVPDVFSFANHPFLINSNLNLNIDGRTTTTIEDSVMLFFAGDYELNVNRQLIAHNVTFAGPGNGERNQWQGLRFNANSGDSDINGSSILNAIQPLRLDNTDMMIDGLYIEQADSDTSSYAIEIIGNSSPDLKDMTMVNYKNGIKVENNRLTRSTPIITNTRIRSSGETSRLGTYGIKIEGPVEVVIGDTTRAIREDEFDIEIDGFETGIELNNPVQTSSTPVIINTRVRNSSDSSRQLMYGIKSMGYLSARINNCDIDEYQYGIYCQASPDTLSRTTPVITNTRIRNSSDSSRTDEIAIYSKSISGIEITNCDVEEYQTGIRIDAANRLRTTPVITNTRVRNSAETSRTLTDGILLNGAVNGTITDCVISNFYNSIFAENLTREVSNLMILNTVIIDSSSVALHERYGIRLEGSISGVIENCDIENIQYGLYYAGNGQVLRDTPVITNTRIRSSGESARACEIGMTLKDLVAIEIGNDEDEEVLIEGYDSGIEIGTTGRIESTPVITNTRVRNSGDSSRTDNYGIRTYGTVTPSIYNSTIEDFVYGIHLANGSQALRTTPVITNTRIRNSGDSTRGDNTGIYLYNFNNVKVDSCEVENYGNGIHVFNGAEQDSMSVISYNRVLFNENANRSYSRGIIISGRNNGEVSFNEIIGPDSAIVVTGFEALPLIQENLLHFNRIASEGVTPVGIFAELTQQSTYLRIFKNTVYNYPVGMQSENTDIFSTSNVIWNTVPTETAIINNGNMEVRFSNIALPGSAVYPGTENINSIPMFKMPTQNDFAYISGSPCIDAGGLALPAEPDGSRADIGKYYEPELVDFYALNPFGVAPHTVQFTDISYGFTGAQISWDTDNDGNYDVTGKNAEFTYTAPGVYSVKVRVTKSGLLETMTKEKLIVIQENLLPAVENFAIQIVDNDVHLSWDALNTGRIGQSRDPNLFYLIYISHFPDKQFAFLNYRAGEFTTYVHEDVLDIEDRAFYQVIGFEGTLRELERFISKQTKYRPLKSKNEARRTKN